MLITLKYFSSGDRFAVIEMTLYTPSIAYIVVNAYLMLLTEIVAGTNYKCARISSFFAPELI